MANPMVIDQRPLGAAGTVLATQEILGPHNFFEYVGSPIGNDLEFSLDGNYFVRLAPGDMLENLQGAPVAYIRNPSAIAETYIVKYGSARLVKANGPQRNCDGRHPVGRSYVSTAAAVAPLLLYPFGPGVSGNERAWRPHLKDLVAFNAGAGAAYIKIARGTAGGAPAVGVDIPIFTLALPAVSHVILTTTHGIRGLDAVTGASATDLYYWISGGAAWNDATAVALNQVTMTCNFC